MKPYSYKWRHEIRPKILDRDGNRCRHCSGCKRLDIAHLDGDNTHDDDANLAALCRLCHRRHDYEHWSAAARATRQIRKDQARPLLVMEL
jgi:hypothetical protein